jgi:SAM-dependent methyltransferase
LIRGEAMKSTLPSETGVCLLCGRECRTVVTGLFDDRFGAPGTFDVIQCPECGLWRTWPMLMVWQFKDLYEQFYDRGVSAESFYASWRDRFFSSDLYRLWLKWDGDIAFHLRRGIGRLLDVGCSDGRGLSHYARNGFQVEGLEINELAAEQARQRGWVVHSGAVADFVPKAPYRVVVLSQVLEHLPDPIATLAQLRRCLEPTGELWIACPNADSIWRSVFGRNWINWHVPYHLWHFTPVALTKVLEKAGFQVDEMTTISPAIWVAQSICIMVGSRPGRINQVMRLARGISIFILGLRAFSFLRGGDRRLRGDCLLAIAKPHPGKSS